MSFDTNYNAQIIASLTSGVLALDKNGRIVTTNPAASKHLGVDEQCLRPGSRLDALSGVGPFVEVVERVMSERQPLSRHEIVLPQENGRKVIGLSASLLEDAGDFAGVIFLFVDLTEVRDLERAVALNRQLARIGELTAGVVHELRNPLAVIRGMAELLQRTLDSDDRRHGTVDQILEETVHLEKTISRFLSFAKPFSLNLGRCDPREIARRACRLCARQAEEKHVHLACDEGAALPEIAADLDKAAQALANVVDNAIDASPERGAVSLRVGREGDHVVFKVLDNGPGIHLSPGQDVFQPFFSLKEDGTGLGLSIVQQIVSAHKGTVSYANQESGGARFEIRLPIDL